MDNQLAHFVLAHIIILHFIEIDFVEIWLSAEVYLSSILSVVLIGIYFGYSSQSKQDVKCNEITNNKRNLMPWFVFGY